MNSLGIDKAPSRTRVVVGMSGGVDSAVTAGLLASQGYEVVGVTLQLYDHGVAIGRKGACCAGQDIYDARQVAEKLGIAHYVLDYESRFRQSVIDEFVDSYVAGETPVPCIRCNQTVKFTDLLGTARELGADALATGHYVRRVMGPNGPELHRAVDASRDQSYFLFATTREQLDFLRFPLGEQSKVETRAMAERLGLEIAAKPDSQDICFVPEGSYAALVEKLRPGALEAGDIVDEAGHVLGRHDGIINFTVGQRRGLGVGGTAEPLFVLKLDPEQKRVIVGPRASLARQEVYLRETSWLDSALVPGAERRIQVKLRSAQPPLPGLLRVGEGGLATILLDEPVLGVAPGQAGAVYEEARVLGGGWLTRAQPQPRALRA